MPELKNYRIFISHAWKYGADYDKLISLLNSTPYFSYYNYSAPKEKPLNLPNTTRDLSKEIAEQLENKIKNSQCILVISGMYYNNKEWMQFEIETAIKYNKPIISIIPWGNSYTPTDLQKVSKIQVGWNSSSIVNAIRTYSN